MAKSTKKRVPARSQRPVSAVKPLPTGNQRTTKPTSAAAVPPGAARKASDGGGAAKQNKSDADTKQSRVLAMLRSPAGATIAAIIQATGWQPHSVRGFLAGVVRKRLKLKLTSKKVDGKRAYQISGGSHGRAHSRPPTRRAA
jgi:hypothetical protein